MPSRGCRSCKIVPAAVSGGINRRQILSLFQNQTRSLGRNRYCRLHVHRFETRLDFHIRPHIETPFRLHAQAIALLVEPSCKTVVFLRFGLQLGLRHIGITFRARYAAALGFFQNDIKFGPVKTNAEIRVGGGGKFQYRVLRNLVALGIHPSPEFITVSRYRGRPVSLAINPLFHLHAASQSRFHINVNPQALSLHQGRQLQIAMHFMQIGIGQRQGIALLAYPSRQLVAGSRFHTKQCIIGRPELALPAE